MGAEFSPRARAVAIGHAAVTACLVIAALLVAATARAAGETGGQSVIGRTWPIAEPDAMAEIEGKAARLPSNMADKFGPRATWSGMRSARLAVADRTRVRTIVPFYTLDTEIRLPDGTLLYPKGFTFNPLVYVSLPQRLVVVHARDLAWAIKAARPSDFILVAARGGPGNAQAEAGIDAIDLTERTGRAIYILEEQVKERLDVTVAPVIIAQKGQTLELREFRLDRPLARKAVP